jgi:hypothetical protein
MHFFGYPLTLQYKESVTFIYDADHVEVVSNGF